MGKARRALVVRVFYPVLRRLRVRIGFRRLWACGTGLAGRRLFLQAARACRLFLNRFLCQCCIIVLGLLQLLRKVLFLRVLRNLRWKCAGRLRLLLLLLVCWLWLGRSRCGSGRRVRLFSLVLLVNLLGCAALGSALRVVLGSRLCLLW